MAAERPKQHRPKLEDLIGIEHCKLGFFQELRQKIEELKAANRESEQRRREIAGILDGITDIMMVVTEDLRIIAVNHVFREIIHDPKPEGKFCYQLFRQENVPCPECPAFRAARTNTVCRETAIFKMNGANRQFEMLATPIQSPDKLERRILIFKRDVTLEKEYQAKFYQAEKMATIGLLAAGVAHEVNNPMAAVSGFAEGIKRRLPNLEGKIDKETFFDIREYVDTILKECRRCQEIVQTLLTFSRPKSSGFSPVSLNNVITDTLRLTQSHMKKCHLNEFQITKEFSKDLPIIYADEPQIKQVVLNLLINAMDAISGDGSIFLRTMPDGENMVRLEVEDTGCGIPEENLDKLFEPFFTTKAVGKGIGIGLSTCYNIVREHKGEIQASSELGKGSCFVVQLPIDPK